MLDSHQGVWFTLLIWRINLISLTGWNTILYDFLILWTIWATPNRHILSISFGFFSFFFFLLRRKQYATYTHITPGLGGISPHDAGVVTSIQILRTSLIAMVFAFRYTAAEAEWVIKSINIHAIKWRKVCSFWYDTWCTNSEMSVM